VALVVGEISVQLVGDTYCGKVKAGGDEESGSNTNQRASANGIHELVRRTERSRSGGWQPEPDGAGLQATISARVEPHCARTRNRCLHSARVILAVQDRASPLRASSDSAWTRCTQSARDHDAPSNQSHPLDARR
jgi:hypothetical protein